ncbi:MAG: PGPGW domain-containing protein [Thermodesulfobacteriota bacterium]|nr:PGPGW domain-containing protein [Thermodesulfobacteriota bacterium]
MALILEWIRMYETALWWLGILSVVTFMGTLVFIPILAVRIPNDYFMQKKENPHGYYRKHMVLGPIFLIVKNFFGMVFVFSGLVMLVLPGQGLITILIGIMLIDFPGKRALERWVIQQPSVLRSINWIRSKTDRQPLQVPERTFTADDNSKKG